MSHLEDLIGRLDRALAGADAALAAGYPGDRGVRQPVHTVYVPGDRYDEKTVAQWSAESVRALAEHGGSAAEVAEAFGLTPGLADEIYDRVTAKLAAEPIEDLRIDFEDGYGARPDEDEDAAVVAAARALAATVRDGSAAPFHGIRIKSF
ncbi:MAG TPA: aldolase, partial [Nocardioides sp.]